MKYTSKDIVFIINPHSGKKKPETIIKKIKKIDKSFNIFVSNTLEEFDKFIEDNIDNYKVFVIAGGDGTINYFTNILFNHDNKALAIIPRGSGNGFAKETGFQLSINKLIRAILEGETYKADIIEINDKKFINVAGIGFDSCVAHLFAQRETRGFVGYVFSTLKCLKTFKKFPAKLSFDNIEIDDTFQMITFANTRQFGNNAFIAPKANPTSGKLDLILVKPFPFYYYPIFLINMFTGKIKESKYISYFQVKSNLTINTLFNKFHIDGDPVIFENTSTIKIHKNKIKIIRTPKAKV